MDDFTLRVFYRLAQLRSFSKVADDLFITQSAVSRQIKNLEDKLAVKLCLREKEGVTLTEEGRILFKYVEKILGLYEKATKEIDHFRHTKLDKIIIGASTTLGEYVLPRIISRFKRGHPEADIYLRVANTREILTQLSGYAFNLVLVESVVDNDSFVVEELFEDELVLIVSVLHPWSKVGRISFSELRSAPIIIREKGSGTRKIMEDTIAKLGVQLSDLNIKMELDSTEAVKSAVGENLGVSFVSKSTLITKPDKIVVVPVTNLKLQFSFHLIYSRDRGLTSLTLELIDCLKETLSAQFKGLDISGSCL
jgi:DNA-binding transcriptional LysR family regulator